jgi:hypothetical protein
MTQYGARRENFAPPAAKAPPGARPGTAGERRNFDGAS